MKNNQKGFTLIELLAIIVILAVIALITTPIILNVVENSRKNAAKDKAYGVVDAVKLAYSTELLNDTTTLGESGSNITVIFSGGDNLPKIGDTSIKISGDIPTKGTVTLNLTSGNVTATKLFFAGDKYCCNVDASGKESCEKKEATAC